MHKSVRWLIIISFAILTMMLILIKDRLPLISARKILEKASIAQEETEYFQGIWHVRIEYYQNPRAFIDRAGSTTITDSYFDYQNGYYRMINEDPAGNLLNARAYDGHYFYNSTQTGNEPLELPLTIYREPDEQKEQMPLYQSGETHKLAFDPTANDKAIFQQFINSSDIEILEINTRSGGKKAFTLAGYFYEEQTLANNTRQQNQSGSMKLVIDGGTYHILASELTTRKNDEDIIVYAMRYLINETLPQNSSIYWDLSDLPGVTYQNIP